MDVLMPQLGETVAEGKIIKWFKSAGDAIKPGDNLFEIETDKVSMEVPSTTTGVLAEIRVVAGEVAPVGAVVGVISDGSGAAPSAPAAPRRLHRVPRRRRRLPKRLRPRRDRPRRRHRKREKLGTRSSSIRFLKCVPRNAITDRPACPAARP